MSIINPMDTEHCDRSIARGVARAILARVQHGITAACSRTER